METNGYGPAHKQGVEHLWQSPAGKLDVAKKNSVPPFPKVGVSLDGLMQKKEVHGGEDWVHEALAELTGKREGSPAASPSACQKGHGPTELAVGIGYAQ